MVSQADLQRIAEGESYRAVASDIGVGLATLHAAFQASGIRRKRVPLRARPETVAAARTVIAGATYRAASKKHGVGIGPLHRCVQQLRKRGEA